VGREERIAMKNRQRSEAKLIEEILKIDPGDIPVYNKVADTITTTITKSPETLHNWAKKAKKYIEANQWWIEPESHTKLKKYTNLNYIRETLKKGNKMYDDDDSHNLVMTLTYAVLDYLADKDPQVKEQRDRIKAEENMEAIR
jgi:hypothetical protein